MSDPFFTDWGKPRHWWVIPALLLYLVAIAVYVHLDRLLDLASGWALTPNGFWTQEREEEVRPP